MRNLLEFLSKYKHWFLFVLLEVISMILLFRFNTYQGSVFFSSANIVSGRLYELSSDITSYFVMGKTNKELTDRNILLEQELKYLRLKLAKKDISKISQDSLLSSLKLIDAEVVSNSLTRLENFITINKGSWDGVRKDMGVASGSGIVGVVYLVGIHYSVIIPVLNSKSNISCSIQGRNYFGYLHWNGGSKDIAYLDDIPRHAKFKIGDKIVTSGYSSIFPSGILVGKILHVYNSADGLSFRLAIKLSTDFGNLRNVCVIDDKSIQEKKDVIDAAEDSIKHLGNDFSTSD